MKMSLVRGLCLLSFSTVLALLVAAVILSAPMGRTALAQTGVTGPDNTLGENADTDFWRQIRKGRRGTVNSRNSQAGQLIQSEGESWRAIRNGPMVKWGGWALFGTIALLALFYAARGRIAIEHGCSGQTIERFTNFERMGHWILAVSFIVLALTGLNMLFGKYVLLPIIGDGAFAFITGLGKWLHNYLAFGFMLGLVIVFLRWVGHNIPNRHDFVWLMQAGGLFSRGNHPPARKFNAGQKILFWLVILFGASISLSGISLLFPFQTTMFADTFSFLNSIGLKNLPTDLPMMKEMQYSQIWHTVVAVVFIALVIGHIYIGTIGMEGAFDAMGTGQVDRNWAKEHHSLWVEQLDGSGKRPETGAATQPAE